MYPARCGRAYGPTNCMAAAPVPRRPSSLWKALRGVDGWLDVGGPEEQVSLSRGPRRRAREQIQRLIERHALAEP